MKYTALATIGLAAAGLALSWTAPASACISNCDLTENENSAVITGPGQGAIAARSIAKAIGNRPSFNAGGGGAVTGAPQKVVSADGMVFNVQTGLGAGDDGGNFSLWGAGSFGHAANTLTETKYSGSATTVSVGGDYMFGDMFVVGLAATLDASNLDTKFNLGNVDSAGYTLTPYAMVMIGDWLTLDVAAGYGLTETDSDRTAGGGPVTGKTHGNRMLFAANVNGFYAIDAWNLNAKASYIYARDTSDPFVESDGTQQTATTANLGELRVGGRVGYVWNQFEPYVAAEYVWDHVMTKITTGANQTDPANDRDEVFGAIGVNYYHSDSVSAAAELSNSFARDEVRNTTFAVNARFQF